MPDGLRRATALATKLDPPTRDQYRRWLSDIDNRLAFLIQEEANAFGVERNSMAPVARDKQELLTQRAWLESQFKYAGKYRALSLDPLGWRGLNDLPLLIPFSLSSPTFVIEATPYQAQIKDARLIPSVINRAYADVLEMLGEKAKRDNNNYTLTYTFDGVIPGEARTKIREAQELDLATVIIAEPKQVQLTRQPLRPPVDPDPLVVGVDRNSQLWLVAEFDVTSIEAKYRDYLLNLSENSDN